MADPLPRRPIAGRLRYATQPEPGTIVGPLWTGEFAVVLGGPDADGMTVLGYAQTDELTRATARERDGEPVRSVTEHVAHKARLTLKGQTWQWLRGEATS